MIFVRKVECLTITISPPPPPPRPAHISIGQIEQLGSGHTLTHQAEPAKHQS